MKVETVWAVGLGNNLYQIKNNLFFFDGVALDDIVEAESLETEEFPIFTKVVNYSALGRDLEIKLLFRAWKEG